MRREGEAALPKYVTDYNKELDVTEKPTKIYDDCLHACLDQYRESPIHSEYRKNIYQQVVTTVLQSGGRLVLVHSCCYSLVV